MEKNVLHQKSFFSSSWIRGLKSYVMKTHNTLPPLFWSIIDFCKCFINKKEIIILYSIQEQLAFHIKKWKKLLISLCPPTQICRANILSANCQVKRAHFKNASKIVWFAHLSFLKRLRLRVAPKQWKFTYRISKWDLWFLCFFVQACSSTAT